MIHAEQKSGIADTVSFSISVNHFPLLKHFVASAKIMRLIITPVSPRQPTRLTKTNAVEISRRERVKTPVWEQLATDQIDPSQDVPRRVFTPYHCLLITVAVVVLCLVGCLWVTGVYMRKATAYRMYQCNTDSNMYLVCNSEELR